MALCQAIDDESGNRFVILVRPCFGDIRPIEVNLDEFP